MNDTEVKLTAEDGVRMWREAKSFEDICELTAMFIEGTVPYLPSYSASIDDETSSLVHYLAAFNRAGFWTECSQPGEIGRYGRQRAFVDGRAPEAIARRLQKLTLHSDLIVLAVPPGWEMGIMLPVTVDDFHMYTEISPATVEDLGFYQDHVSETLFPELGLLWSISIFDPHWGRNEYLWELVAAEICYTIDRREDD